MKMSFERKDLKKLIELMEDTKNSVRVEFEFQEKYSESDYGYINCIWLGIVNNRSLIDMLKNFINNQKDNDSYIDWLNDDYFDSGLGYWEYFNIGSLEKTNFFYYDKWIKEDQWEDEDGNIITDFEDEEIEDDLDFSMF